MNDTPNSTRELTLSLTTDEVNLILEAVGQLPFVRVYALVSKLQQQARQQLAGNAREQPHED